jgi:4-aminobutyrate aminotransferase
LLASTIALPLSQAVLPEVAAEMSLDSIKQLLKETTAPSETAAIIIEPILGEGGYVVPPKGFFTGLRKVILREWECLQ